MTCKGTCCPWTLWTLELIPRRQHQQHQHQLPPPSTQSAFPRLGRTCYATAQKGKKPYKEKHGAEVGRNRIRINKEKKQVKGTPYSSTRISRSKISKFSPALNTRQKHVFTHFGKRLNHDYRITETLIAINRYSKSYIDNRNSQNIKLKLLRSSISRLIGFLVYRSTSLPEGRNTPTLGLSTHTRTSNPDVTLTIL